MFFGFFSMGMQVREKNLEEIKEKLSSLGTDLNRIAYLESALKESGFSFEIKRFIFSELAEMYEGRKMYEKAARVVANKAGIDVTFREKVEDYVRAAELYAKQGKVEDAEEMFVRASRDVNEQQKGKLVLARKNIYMSKVAELESVGKKGAALKFYEKLIKMKLDEIEKKEVRFKLLQIYKALGRFKDAELLKGK